MQGLALAAWLVGTCEEASAAPPLFHEQVTSKASRVGAGIADNPSEGTEAQLLPDLRTLPPVDLEVQVDRDGVRVLRLTNLIWNSGAGPLEVVGEFNRATRRTQVHQRVYSPSLDSKRSFQEIPVGEFVWHPRHDHWHMEGFALYALWSLSAHGRLDQVVSSSDKLSYCLMDTDVIDPNNPAYLPRRRYYECNQALQGLSAGWGDEYKAYLDGQSLDLSGVRDGFYALVSTANPEGLLVEATTDNNTAVVYLEIRGSRFTVVPPEELSERRCTENGWC